jgi:excinuclease ABC subunit C
VNFDFTPVHYDRATYLTEAHPSMPKGSAVYRIFDKRNKLIVLDKTSNLFERLERYFGERNELVRDLDLREIAARIEFRRTWSPFETTYVLYVQRRDFFPKTYRKMRTFRLFTLLKLNRRQRFPRIYASRDIKAGAEYFGPFETRSQFTRLKTELERTFRLRPCLYNIRGNDPHPDCLYFQMHTCSRPCNNDIDRAGYLEDVESAIEFIQGKDEQLSAVLRTQMEALAAKERFEEAGALQRKSERIQRARKEIKETYRELWQFDYVVLLPADSTSRVNVAFCRSGGIVRFDCFDAATLVDILPEEAARELAAPPPEIRRDWQYDEFCLVAGYLLHPLKSVEVLPMHDDAGLRAHLKKRERSSATSRKS